ncbi:hypothetical protein [Mucilaginibacter pineti]|uniref:hypothetical protein n=1 Tax=Mucilaginibacter pineti TaxID=1391627 RepID=UPI0013BE8F15|nr:hypothetical protein [Mucilaginibacter pineti]
MEFITRFQALLMLIVMFPFKLNCASLLRFFANDQQNTINVALNCDQEWGVEFAASVLLYMANNPYVYNRAFFHKYISLIPASIIHQLEKIAPGDANLQNAWEKSKHHLIKLLGLKQQTLKAFNA